MKTFVEKIKSRKFLAAVAGVVTGLAMVFGLDEGVISTVAGAVTALASVVSYIITEGKIDESAIDKVKDAIEAGKKAEEELKKKEVSA